MIGFHLNFAAKLSNKLGPLLLNWGSTLLLQDHISQEPTKSSSLTPLKTSIPIFTYAIPKQITLNGAATL